MMNDRFKLAQEEGFQKGLTNFWAKHYEALFTNKPDLLGPKAVALVNNVNMLKSMNGREGVLITINAPDTMLHKQYVKDFWAQAQKLFDKKYFGYSIMAMEFSDEDGEYTHPHIHMYADFVLNKCKSELIRETYNTMKEHVNNKQCVDVRFIPKFRRVATIEYCTKNREPDIKYRHKYGIPEMSENDFQKIEKNNKTVSDLTLIDLLPDYES